MCFDMCVEPDHDQCPVVVPKEAGESLALPVVALTRSQAGCAPVFTWPVKGLPRARVEYSVTIVQYRSGLGWPTVGRGGIRALWHVDRGLSCQ